MSRTDVFQFVINPCKTFILCQLLFPKNILYANINICRCNQCQRLKNMKILIYYSKSFYWYQQTYFLYKLLLQCTFVWNRLLHDNVQTQGGRWQSVTYDQMTYLQYCLELPCRSFLLFWQPESGCRLKTNFKVC